MSDTFDHECEACDEKDRMTDAQKFTELTGGKWENIIDGVCDRCGTVFYANPTYSTAADILNRMKEFCGVDKYENFICTVGSITPLFDEPPIYSIEEKYILNPSALLQKAIEFLEGKGE